MSYDFWSLASRPVTHAAVTVTVGQYPLNHILHLLAQYGDADEVVDRLECDGWLPHEIAAGAADPGAGA